VFRTGVRSGNKKGTWRKFQVPGKSSQVKRREKEPKERLDRWQAVPEIIRRFV